MSERIRTYIRQHHLTLAVSVAYLLYALTIAVRPNATIGTAIQIEHWFGISQLGTAAIFLIGALLMALPQWQANTIALSPMFAYAINALAFVLGNDTVSAVAAGHAIGLAIVATIIVWHARRETLYGN